MKKCKWVIVMCVLCIMCTACSGNKDNHEENNNDEMKEVITEEGSAQVYTLSSETEDVSIEILIPEEFQQTEYSSESGLALEIPGEDDDSSTQLMMYLEADPSIDVKKVIVEEVNYLMSANTEDWEKLDYVEGVSADHYVWSYVTYELEGLKGYKFCADMQNGSALVATIEFWGDISKEFDIAEFIRQIDNSIIAE